MKYGEICIAVAMSVLAMTACVEKTEDINVMSFNIRYDNPADAENSWKYRKDVAAQVILEENIDIVGMQEVLHSQLLDLSDRLPEYSYLGVGRNDGVTEGEYSAIFYRTDRFEKIESGYFWLSETPEIAGKKGWDAACERIATWVVLKDRMNDKELLFMNTHFDHVGLVARRKSVSLLTDRAAQIANGRPVIITGDFNAEPNDEVIVSMTGDGNAIMLYDSRELAQVVTNDASGTFHDFGRIAEAEQPYIDYIFVTEDVAVNSYWVLDAKKGGVYLSDHIPVAATLKIK